MAFDVDILPDDPFANDLLKRREVADNLTKLIGKLTSPTVIGIAAPWGFGKTTFVKMWKQLLENDGFECIYFNAWENDFTTIPLIPFLAEFDIHFSTRIKEGQGGLEGLDLPRFCGHQRVGVTSPQEVYHGKGNI